MSQLMDVASIMESAMKKWSKKGRVSLTGGEPFMEADLLFRLLDFFEQSEPFHWIGILSNGTLIDDAIANRLKHFTKLSEVQISLDGATPSVHDKIRGKGSFEKAVRALTTLRRHGLYTSVMFTMHKQNADSALAVLDLVHELGVDAVTIERVTPMNDDMENLFMEKAELKEAYSEIYQKKLALEKQSNIKVRVSRPLWNLIDSDKGGFCPAGLSSLTILDDATVLPCRRLEIPLGNILTDGLYKIWYTSEVLWKLRNKKSLSGKCHGCERIYACGGCRALAYAVFNDYMAEDPQCWRGEAC